MSEQAGIKEPGYFADDVKKVFGARPIGSWDDYLRLFSNIPDSISRVGEASVCYLASDCAVPRIITVSPEARFVVMIRNPVEIARGMHSQRVKEETENILDFQEAWRNQHVRMQGRRIPEAFSDPMALQYGKLAKIGVQMSRLFDRVPRGHVHVVVYDDFFSGSIQCYRDLLRFINVGEDPRKSFPAVNQRKYYRSLLLQNGLLRLKKIRETLRIPGGWGLQRFIDRHNYVLGSRPLRSTFREELNSYFAADVKLLSLLLNRDFTSWLS